jgi:hypothetical protein
MQTVPVGGGGQIITPGQRSVCRVFSLTLSPTFSQGQHYHTLRMRQSLRTRERKIPVPAGNKALVFHFNNTSFFFFFKKLIHSAHPWLTNKRNYELSSAKQLNMILPL